MSSRELIRALPADVRRMIYLRQAKRVGIFALWYGALAFGVFKYISAVGMRSAPVGNIIALIFVFGVIPFFIMHAEKIFTESTYEGVLEEVKTVGNWGRSAVISRSDKVSDTGYARLKIKLDNGSFRYITLENADGRYNEYYTVGDRVRHYRYIEIPENPDRRHRDSVVCVACGEFYDYSDEKCTKCGCTLIK